MGVAGGPVRGIALFEVGRLDDSVTAPGQALTGAAAGERVGRVHASPGSRRALPHPAGPSSTRCDTTAEPGLTSPPTQMSVGLLPVTADGSFRKRGYRVHVLSLNRYTIPPATQTSPGHPSRSLESRRFRAAVRCCSNSRHRSATGRLHRRARRRARRYRRRRRSCAPAGGVPRTRAGRPRRFHPERFTTRTGMVPVASAATPMTQTSFGPEPQICRKASSLLSVTGGVRLVQAWPFQ